MVNNDRRTTDEVTSRSHTLGEIDDDGHRDSFWRNYRYVCRCGKAGPWQPSRALARGDHAVHCLDMEGIS